MENKKNRDTDIFVLSNGDYYCKSCKKTFEKKSALYFLGDGGIDKILTSNIICSHCGNITENLLYLKTEYCYYKTYFIEGNKLNIIIRSIKYGYNYQTKTLYPTQITRKYTLNLDTGFAYKLPTLVNNKKEKESYIYNCTYQINIFMPQNIDDTKESHNDFFARVYNEIRNYKMEKHDNFIAEAPKNLYIDDIFIFNRFPFLPHQYYFIFRKAYVTNKYEKYFYKNIRRGIKQEDINPIATLFKTYSLSNSKTNRFNLELTGLDYLIGYEVIKDKISIDNYYKIFDIGFNNISSLNTIMTSLKLDKKTINNLCNKIQKKTISNIALHDLFNMLKYIITFDEDYHVDWKLPLRNLHDKLASDYRKIKFPNIPIDYKDVEKKMPKSLEGKYGDLTFKLATCTHELIEVGSEMNICVGSYRDSTLSHSCYIVIARDNNGTPIICIELDKNCFGIVQTKLKFNNYLNEEQTELLLQWAKVNDLIPCNFDMDMDLKFEYVKNNYEVLKAKTDDYKDSSDFWRYEDVLNKSLIKQDIEEREVLFT